MTTNSYQPVTHLLQHEHTNLQVIMKKVEQLKRIDTWIKSHLDSPLAANFQVANLRDNCLILMTSNASIATQLRLYMHEIVTICKQDPDLSHIKTIQCKIGYPISPAALKKDSPNKISLSTAAAQCLAETAKLLQDPKLRAILEKIARQAQAK